MEIREVSCFVDRINRENHLSHLIKSAEDELYEADKDYVKRKKEKLASKGANQAEMDQILRYEQDNVFSKIMLVSTEDNGRNYHGFTALFNKGAKIYYAFNDDHLTRHLIIAHEVGHLLLHTERNERDERVFKATSKNDWLRCEIEASYFAETYLRKMENYFNGESKAYKDEEKRKMIRESILSIHREYDLSQIGMLDDMV